MDTRRDEYKKKWHHENYKTYYDANKSRIRKRKLEYYHRTKLQRKSKVKAYQTKTKGKIQEYKAWYNPKYRSENKEKIKITKKKYYVVNRYVIQHKQKIYNKNRYASDILYRLRIVARGRLGQIFRHGFTKTKHTITLIGCSWETLKKYIESKFKPNMSWNNYGKFGWHMDHIIPLSSAKTKEDVERLCHYTNLQPLWQSENLSKGSKYG